MLNESCAGRVVTILDLDVCRVLPLRLWWCDIGEVEVRNVGDVVVVSTCSRPHRPEHTGITVVVLVLKDGANTGHKFLV